MALDLVRKQAKEKTGSELVSAIPQATTSTPGLVPSYETGSFALDNGITGTVYYTRIGNLVTLSWNSISHSSASSATSSTGLIPASLRPTGGFQNNIFVQTGSPVRSARVEISATGYVAFVYYQDDNGSLIATTGTGNGSITYSRNVQ